MANVLAANAAIAAGSSPVMRGVMNPPPNSGSAVAGTGIPSEFADAGLTDPNALTPTTSAWDSGLDFMESPAFNYAVTGATAAVVVGSAAVGAVAAGGGLVAAATAGAVAAGSFALVMGVGMLAGAVGNWVGVKLSTAAFEAFGFEKFGASSDSPATMGHQIAHSFALAGFWGLLAAAAIAAVAVVTLGAGLLVIAAIAAVGGLAMGFASTAGKYGSNKGPISIGSPNVFFEKKPVARLGDLIACSQHSSSPQALAEGSKTVFANNLPIVRVGHKTTCAGAVNEGCKTISITLQTHPMRLTIDPGNLIRILRTLTIITNLIPWSKKGGNKSNKTNGKDGACTSTCKDPIDVSNGDFLDSRTDFSVPATLPIYLTRHYRSKSEEVGILGHKWSNTWSQHLEIEGDEIHFHDEEGQVITFYNPEDEINTEHTRHPHLILSGKKSKDVTLYNQNEQRYYTFGHRAKGRHMLSKIYDRNNNSLSFEYQENGLKRLLHSDGLRLDVTSQNWLIKQVRLFETNHISHTLADYKYDKNFYLSHVKSDQSGAFNYQYDEKGRIIQWSDTKDTAVYYRYDGQGRIIETGAKSGHHKGQLVYNDKERSTTVLSANNKQETYYYDKDGLVTRFIDANKQEWLTHWNQQFQIKSSTDPLGNQYHYKYDDQNNLIESTDPEGRKNTLSYTEDGLIKAQTDAKGDTWKYAYDEKGNLQTITNPLGETQGYRLDDNGQVLRIDFPNNSQHRIEYDQYHRPQVLQNSQGHRQQLEYDVLGRLISETDGDKNTTHYEYQRSDDNLRCDLSQILQHDDSRIRYTYDQEGQIKTHTDAEGNTTHYQHGAFDLLESITDPQGHTLRFEYDEETRFKAVINQKGERYHYQYDQAGNLIKETDYSGLETHYRYDAAGKLSHTQKPDKSITEYHYDASGLLLRKLTQQAGQKETSSYYRYDEVGQLLSINNGVALLEYEYDALGRITQESIDGKTTQYQYKKGTAQAIQRKGDQQTHHYQYDPEGNLSQFKIGDHKPLNYLRNNRGQELSRHSNSGFQQIQRWDSFGRLSQQMAGNTDQLAEILNKDIYLPEIPKHPQEAQLQASRRYNWDKNHNLIKQQDQHRGTQKTTYDSRQQISLRQYAYENNTGLNTATLPKQEQYQYTANQQPATQHIEKSLGDGAQNDYQYSKAGRVTQKGNVHYLYDNAGRQIEKTNTKKGFRPQIWKYRWNAEGQLSQLQTPQGEHYEYHYDGLGRRIRKLNQTQNIINSSENETEQSTIVGTQYHWEGDNLTQEAPIYADGTIAWDKADEWIYQPNSFIPLAKRTAEDELFYVVTDHLGTPKELVTEDGKHTAWSGQLDTWGKARNDPEQEPAYGEKPKPKTENRL